MVSKNPEKEKESAAAKRQKREHGALDRLTKRKEINKRKKKGFSMLIPQIKYGKKKKKLWLNSMKRGGN